MPNFFQKFKIHLIITIVVLIFAFAVIWQVSHSGKNSRENFASVLPGSGEVEQDALPSEPPAISPGQDFIASDDSGVKVVKLAPKEKVFESREIYGVGIIADQDVSAQKISDFFSFYNSVTYKILIDEGTGNEQPIRVFNTSSGKRAQIRLFYISHKTLGAEIYGALTLSNSMPKAQMVNRLKQLMGEQGVSIGTIVDLSEPIPESFNF